MTFVCMECTNVTWSKIITFFSIPLAGSCTSREDILLFRTSVAANEPMPGKLAAPCAEPRIECITRSMWTSYYLFKLMNMKFILCSPLANLWQFFTCQDTQCSCWRRGEVSQRFFQQGKAIEHVCFVFPSESVLLMQVCLHNYQNIPRGQPFCWAGEAILFCT